jgi:flagellar basal body rod protein FlgB
VLIDSHSEFACVDGPEFDAQKVNFEVLMQRNTMYRDNEQKSLNQFLANPQAEVERVRESCKLRELEEKTRAEATHV